MGATRVELPEWESVELLGRETVGRLCIIDHGYPLAFPLNYRMLRDAERTRIVFRTNPSSALARYEGPASMEVDRIDPTRPAAWSVIVRGNLRRVVGQHELPDTYPLVTNGRFQWVVLDVVAISGRRFTAQSAEDEFVVEWQSTA
jgi:nitroimidazol reductase NimA-like FMN-containing flavoprotein (pyridoxamine 5'-phosphate oxidase superfamily)